MKRRVLVPFRETDRSKPYLEAVAMAGLETVPFVTTATRRLDDVAGLVLTGGTDIDPARFGEAPHPKSETPDVERDEVESAMLAEALQRDMPVLAICRGFQLLNVHQGGTLVQHIESGKHRVITRNKGLPAHDVDLEPDSQIARLLQGTKVAVNSRHHQAIGRLGSGLVLTGRSTTDEIPEAVEMPGKRFVLGVQWHPENQVPHDAVQARLFFAFAEAVNH